MNNYIADSKNGVYSYESSVMKKEALLKVFGVLNGRNIMI